MSCCSEQQKATWNLTLQILIFGYETLFCHLGACDEVSAIQTCTASVFNIFQLCILLWVWLPRQPMWPDLPSSANKALLSKSLETPAFLPRSRLLPGGVCGRNSLYSSGKTGTLSSGFDCRLKKISEIRYWCWMARSGPQTTPNSSQTCAVTPENADTLHWPALIPLMSKLSMEMLTLDSCGWSRKSHSVVIITSTALPVEWDVLDPPHESKVSIPSAKCWLEGGMFGMSWSDLGDHNWGL